MALAPSEVGDERDKALLRAIGFDKLAPAQRELALNIAQRYQLDPMLKHLVMIEGGAYITRDGLLHIAHRSGFLDGIETTEPYLDGDFWRAKCSVFRKDMSRPFVYGGRYPAKGGNAKYAPEMAIKVAEVMALRRAFDVAAPTAEERWDDAAIETFETPSPPTSLAATITTRVSSLQPVGLTVNGSERIPVSHDDPPPADPATPVLETPILAAPMTMAASAAEPYIEPEEEASDAIERMSVAELSRRARDAGKSKMAFASALDCLPADVGKRIESMTDQERWKVASILGLAS